MWAAVKKIYQSICLTVTTKISQLINRFFKNTFENKQTAFKAIFTKIVTFFLFAFLFIYLFFYFSLFFQISLVRGAATWMLIILLSYWIVSAVWCLYDKDDFGRNVSASDDFYNVAFSALWLVEGFLLSLFLSYTKLFDFYDSFTEPEELESLYYNEDADGTEILTLLVSFLSIQFTLAAIDLVLTWESFNPFWVICFLVLTIFWLFFYFIKISVQFIEEFDFEEQNDDIFDDEDTIFEFEDFVDEGVDGGDYAESYEILQLFFSYWHYMFICLHVFYLSYAVFTKKGKQTHVYWAVIAICQNIILILILDVLDWGELLLFFEIPQQSTLYSWFYISEDPAITFQIYWSIIKQYIEYFTPLNLSKIHSHIWQKEYWSFEAWQQKTLMKTFETYIEIANQNFKN